MTRLSIQIPALYPLAPVSHLAAIRESLARRVGTTPDLRGRAANDADAASKAIPETGSLTTILRISTFGENLTPRLFG